MSVMIIGCTGNQISDNRIENGEEISKEVDKIDITLIDKTDLPQGRAYSLELKNKSSYLIKQNSVYLSFPIISKDGNGYIGNPCKVEASNNKLDISPEEEVILNVFVPIENYINNASLDIERPQIELKGYLSEVKKEYHFQKIEYVGF